MAAPIADHNSENVAWARMVCRAKTFNSILNLIATHADLILLERP